MRSIFLFSLVTTWFREYKLRQGHFVAFPPFQRPLFRTAFLTTPLACRLFFTMGSVDWRANWSGSFIFKQGVGGYVACILGQEVAWSTPPLVQKRRPTPAWCVQCHCFSSANFIAMGYTFLKHACTSPIFVLYLSEKHSLLKRQRCSHQRLRWIRTKKENA